MEPLRFCGTSTDEAFRLVGRGVEYGIGKICLDAEELIFGGV